MRLFVSVDLEGLAESVAFVQERFEGASGLSPVDPEDAHVTLKFLGDVDQGDLTRLVDGLEAAVDAAAVDPFHAEFGGLGAFPSEDYIRVVWLGVREGGEAMTRLHEAVEERTVELGFDPERHEFTPHVTLARMNHAGGKEHVQEVLRTEDPAVGSMEVEEVRLTKSELTEEGPRYETVERFWL